MKIKFKPFVFQISIMTDARIPMEIIGNDLAKLIIQHLNFVCARHGVHIQLRHVISNRRLTIPRHKVKRGLMAEILRTLVDITGMPQQHIVNCLFS